ncbi:DUF501 domain-containing protein [Acetohalobium arabaticum]|uniref:DUF501 domain-containing protein n=1 Tax=Acetohalobium arabaticum (strain ATCC 49924 / DSM 5501 / Z-7288) TaxID=574087 RepID=D9QSW9_ACEAZ|nr:DUF501 domain-containing protein [Acetohalobium arabaticum]ADL11657.1 protein of unknown function DUF501 [Acetohalobium arabaticum DSM 5501]
MERKPTAKDYKVITQQLEREPRNLVGIAKWCQEGYPQVLVTYPVLEEKDELKLFPTTYWLSCPKLVEEIFSLESEGLIQQVQEEIMADSNKEQELTAAHRNYAQKRVGLLKDSDLTKLKEEYPGRWKVVSQSGVGGIMEKEGIKCLHTHYADYLVNRHNPVGKIVDELLEDRFLDSSLDGCSICSKED